MERTPPYRRFGRSPESNGTQELELPPTAPLRLTPRGRAALAALRAHSQADGLADAAFGAHEDWDCEAEA